MRAIAGLLSLESGEVSLERYSGAVPAPGVSRRFGLACAQDRIKKRSDARRKSTI